MLYEAETDSEYTWSKEVASNRDGFYWQRTAQRSRMKSVGNNIIRHIMEAGDTIVKVI